MLSTFYPIRKAIACGLDIIRFTAGRLLEIWNAYAIGSKIVFGCEIEICALKEDFDF